MLSGYEERRAAFSELGVSLFAATVDSEEDVATVAAGCVVVRAVGRTYSAR